MCSTSRSSIVYSVVKTGVCNSHSGVVGIEYSAAQFRSTPDSSRISRVRIPRVDIAFGLASNNLLKFVWKTEAYAG
jgi:hypothetical protein